MADGLEDLRAELEDARAELRGAYVLLWTATKMAGGRLSISYSDMREYSLPESKLQLHDDTTNDRIVLTVK